MARKRCCICEEAFLVGEAFHLTDAEMAAIGPGAVREIHYCSGCLKAMRNLKQGANILTGFFERTLRDAGVPGADTVADRFRQDLLKAATRKLQ